MNVSLRLTSFNSNGVLGKLPVHHSFLNEKSSLLCLQEHHLLGHSLNLLSSLSTQHDIFAVCATPAGGRPSGGLATILPKSLNTTILAFDTNFLACSFSNVVLISWYFPNDYHDDISFDAFTQCCFNLSRFVSSLQSNLRTYILGDFNCDPNIANERGTILSSYLPNFSVSPKSQDFTYIHWSGSTTNIDHVFSSNPSDPLPVVIIIEDPLLTACASVPFTPLASRSSPVRFSGSKLPKFFDLVDWNPNFKPLYQERVGTLIGKVFIPDSLDSMDSDPSLTITCLYFELIHCLKYGAAAVFSY